MSKRNITTILFDCDNTLVQSEPIGFEASADITNEILVSNGVHDVQFTGPQLQRDFVGTTFQVMMRNILTAYNLNDRVELSDTELAAYADEEDARVIAKVSEPGKLKPCEGVNMVLQRLHKEGRHRLAVVSSSAMARIKASLVATDQAHFFSPEHVFSVPGSLSEPVSKPDPAIYLHALQKLQVTARQSIAIEDSRSGVKSARSAGIVVIGYTGGYEPEERESQGDVLKEAGCEVVMHDWADFQNCFDAIIANTAN